MADDAVRQDGSCQQNCSGGVTAKFVPQNIDEDFQATVLAAQANGSPERTGRVEK